jgi:hypothetical protein
VQAARIPTLGRTLHSCKRVKKIPAFRRGCPQKKSDKFEGLGRLFAVRSGIDIKHSQGKQAKGGNNQDQEILFGTGHGWVPRLMASMGVIVPVKNKFALI